MWKGYLTDVFSDRYKTGTANSSGQVTHSVGAVPEGYCWYLNRETLYSNTTATAATFELYVLRANSRPTDTTKAGRQDYTTGTLLQNGVNDLAAPIYVGPGYFIVLVWSGLNQGDIVSWSGQILSHKLEAHQVRHHGIAPLANEKEPTAVVVPDQLAAV